MKAVILVGGEGTRLRPLTCNVPKPMLPLVNVPFLEHAINYMGRHGIRDIVLSMCYRPDVIQGHFGDGSAFGVRLAYAVEETPLGTAGGIKNVEHLIDDTFFVFNGDILTDLDLDGMLAAHRGSRAIATISLTPVDDPTAYGLVETTGEGRVTAFVEKPTWDRVTTNLINAGTYILEPEILHHVPASSFFMFERGLFPLLLERGDRLYGYPSNAYWLDIGTPQKYLMAHHDVLTGRVSVLMPGEQVRPGVWIAGDGAIDASVKLVPPVVLGRGVHLGQDVTVIGPTSIHDGCQVGRESLIEGSVIWGETVIADRVSIEESLIGSGCRIGDGVVVAGGSVVADGCDIGSGNRLDKGIRIWPGRRIEPDTISF